jgi:hypothetical protein
MTDQNRSPLPGLDRLRADFVTVLTDEFDYYVLAGGQPVPAIVNVIADHLVAVVQQRASDDNRSGGES